ncbi:MAG: hypothetical protein LBM95_02135 [Lactobacillales bacterium]|nr:hypothetical protein [Lactobacillales bacterium]
MDKTKREHEALIQLYERNGGTVEIQLPDKKLPSVAFSRDFGACVKERYILRNYKHVVRCGEQITYEK